MQEECVFLANLPYVLTDHPEASHQRVSNSGTWNISLGKKVGKTLLEANVPQFPFEFPTWAPTIPGIGRSVEAPCGPTSVVALNLPLL